MTNSRIKQLANTVASNLGFGDLEDLEQLSFSDDLYTFLDEISLILVKRAANFDKKDK